MHIYKKIKTNCEIKCYKHPKPEYANKIVFFPNENYHLKKSI